MVLVARRPHALYGQRTSTGDEEPAGDVVLRDTTSGAAAVLGSAFAPELAVYAASAAAGLWVGSALTDLTENFEFRRFDGAPVEGFADPTEDLPYNAPPLLVFAVLSPGGQRLAYLSGPDHDGATGRTSGHWELVIADRTGTDLLRLPLAGQDLRLTHLDFDGRWALVSSARSGNDPGDAAAAGDGARPPLLIDTQGGPATYELDALSGRATLDVAHG